MMLPFDADFEQTRFPQHLEVVGQRRLCNIEICARTARFLGCVSQCFDNLKPVRITQGLENGC